MQNNFLKNIKSLVNAIEELGNFFKEDKGDLLALDTKDIMPKEVVESVRTIQKVGRDQYNAFVTEIIISKTKSSYRSHQAKQTSTAKYQLEPPSSRMYKFQN